MKQTHLLLLMLVAQTSLFAQKYFPEGTKWTEIRLDTLKYDTWYSRQGDEWIPNFETVEYFVKGEFIDADQDFQDYYGPFKCIYANSIESADSLILLVSEATHAEAGEQRIEVTLPLFDDGHCLFWPSYVYEFNWYMGLTLYSQTIENAQSTGSFTYSWHKFGTIEEIKEQNFGGVKSLQYVDLDGVRIIHGLGVTEWNDGECLFGPAAPYATYRFFQTPTEDHFVERHYRSMLVHFERDGEVLYDVWPDKTDGIKNVGQTHPEISVTTSADDASPNPPRASTSDRGGRW